MVCDMMMMMITMIRKKTIIILRRIPEINKTLSDDKSRYFEADFQRFGHNFGIHHQERWVDELCDSSPENTGKL